MAFPSWPSFSPRQTAPAAARARRVALAAFADSLLLLRGGGTSSAGAAARRARALRVSAPTSLRAQLNILLLSSGFSSGPSDNGRAGRNPRSLRAARKPLCCNPANGNPLISNNEKYHKNIMIVSWYFYDLYMDNAIYAISKARRLTSGSIVGTLKTVTGTWGFGGSDRSW